MSITEISRVLARYDPKTLATRGKRHAAVALILREHNNEMEILYIERAQREDDPWSGQIAFPGGNVDSDDVGARAAAERETLEEVGLDLTASQYLGRIDDMEGRLRGAAIGLVISCFVYFQHAVPRFRLNHEVAQVLWVPWLELLRPEKTLCYVPSIVPGTEFPAVRIGEKKSHILWGLTYRFTRRLYILAGQDLPQPDDLV